jgi:hypothetical protein
MLFNVATVQYLQFLLHVMLLRTRIMFCTITLTVCVQCQMWLFSVIPRIFAFVVCCSGTV